MKSVRGSLPLAGSRTSNRILGPTLPNDLVSKFGEGPFAEVDVGRRGVAVLAANASRPSKHDGGAAGQCLNARELWPVRHRCDDGKELGFTERGTSDESVTGVVSGQSEGTASVDLVFAKAGLWGWEQRIDRAVRVDRDQQQPARFGRYHRDSDTIADPPVLLGRRDGEGGGVPRASEPLDEAVEVRPRARGAMVVRWRRCGRGACGDNNKGCPGDAHGGLNEPPRHEWVNDVLVWACLYLGTGPVEAPRPTYGRFYARCL